MIKDETHACAGGEIAFYKHDSDVLGCEMRFSVFTPPEAEDGPVPVLWWLSGLTCTAENFTTKAGAYNKASELGLMIIAPDTSPRGDDVPNHDDYDLGQGAGFYVNAKQEPWARHYKMYDYIACELPALIAEEFPADMERQGIFGHSMGGHGALMLGLRHPKTYSSISAFAPIAHPTTSEWGIKALSAYLGDDQDKWAEYDTCRILENGPKRSAYESILVDQGLDDQFLDRLGTDDLEAACKKAGQRLRLRRQPGYDHSYYFISTFMDDHLLHHHSILVGNK